LPPFKSLHPPICGTAWNEGVTDYAGWTHDRQRRRGGHQAFSNDNVCRRISSGVDLSGGNVVEFMLCRLAAARKSSLRIEDGTKEFAFCYFLKSKFTAY
jgi:hypothetical protein